MSKRPASQELGHDPLMAKRYSHLKITSHDDIAPAQDFALSILENRELAQYVRKVSLNYSHWAGFPTEAFPYTVTTEAERENETRFKAAIAEQKWEEMEAAELLKRLMTTALPDFNEPTSYQLFPDAVVALLLPILPNVQKWIVGDITRPNYVEKAIQRAKDGIFGSISVTHIEILPDTRHSYAAWGVYQFPAFKIFQNLPSLESIKGKGIGGHGIEDSGSYYDIPSKASNVREIHLKDCELSGQCLSKIIDFSTGLRAFTYRFGGRSGTDGIAAFYSPELGQALMPHRSTMQSLDLDTENLIRWSLADEVQRWEQSLREEANTKGEYEENSEEEDEDEDENEEEDGEDSGEEDVDEEGSDAETLNSLESKESAQRWEEATESEPYFPNVTHLRIGIKLASRFVELSGKTTLAEWLPSSLKELEIVGNRPNESGIMAEQLKMVVHQREELLPNLTLLKGVDEYIDCGKELADEGDYVASDGSIED